jgi:hypothetical protein
MALTKTPKTPKLPKADKPVIAKNLTSVKHSVGEPFLAPLTPVISLDRARYGQIQFVTSMELKRRVVPNGYYAKFFVPHDHYTDLNAVGINYHCTWDEVLRGMIEMLMRDIPTYERLKDYLPINHAV